MYHVRAVTQTDVVRAGTRDVAKIFQILYDVDAVSGPGSITYLGGTGDVSMSNGGGKRVNNSIFFNTSENSSLLNHSSNNGNTSKDINNSTLSTTLLHNDNFSDSAISSTIRSMNGGLSDDHSTGRLNPDAISVGSNDSGEVNGVSSLFLNILLKYFFKFVSISY